MTHPGQNLVSVWLPDPLIRFVTKLAAEHDETRSDFVRDAITKHALDSATAKDVPTDES